MLAHAMRTIAGLRGDALEARIARAEERETPRAGLRAM